MPKLTAEAKEKLAKAVHVVELVIGEFVSTERGYVADLATLCHEFLIPIQAARAAGHAVCAQEVESVAFGQLNILLPLNEQLLASLQAVTPAANALMVAQTFISFAPYFKMYSAYINSYVSAQELVDQELSDNKVFAAFCQEGTRRNHALQSLLIKPVQRIPRYKLLLGELHKRAGKAGAPAATLAAIMKASDAVSVVAMACNDRVSHVLANQRVIDLHSQFHGDAAPTHIASRKLLREGTLATMSRRLKQKPRVLILFNDMLLYCHASSKVRGLLFRGTASIEVTAAIPTATLIAKPLDLWADEATWDTHERTMLEFAFVVSSPERSFVAIAEDAEERLAWLEALQGAAQDQWSDDFKRRTNKAEAAAIVQVFSAKKIAAEKSAKKGPRHKFLQRAKNAVTKKKKKKQKGGGAAATVAVPPRPLDMVCAPNVYLIAREDGTRAADQALEGYIEALMQAGEEEDERIASSSSGSSASASAATSSSTAISGMASTTAHKRRASKNLLKQLFASRRRATSSPLEEDGSGGSSGGCPWNRDKARVVLCRISHTIVARNPGEISVVEGEVVQQLRKSYQKRVGWWFVMNAHGECGGLPAPSAKLLKMREVQDILAAWDTNANIGGKKKEKKAAAAAATKKSKSKSGGKSKSSKPQTKIKASTAPAISTATTTAGPWTYVPTAAGFKSISVRSLSNGKGRVLRKITGDGSEGPWVVTKRVRSKTYLKGTSCSFLKLAGSEADKTSPGWVCDTGTKSKALLLEERKSGAAGLFRKVGRGLGLIRSSVAPAKAVVHTVGKTAKAKAKVRPTAKSTQPRVVQQKQKRKTTAARSSAAAAVRSGGRQLSPKVRAAAAKSGKRTSRAPPTRPPRTMHLAGAKAKLASVATGLFRNIASSLNEVDEGDESSDDGHHAPRHPPPRRAAAAAKSKASKPKPKPTRASKAKPRAAKAKPRASKAKPAAMTHRVSPPPPQRVAHRAALDVFGDAAPPPRRKVAVRKAAPSRSSRRPPPDAHAPGGPPPLPTRHVEERPDNFIARAKQKQQLNSQPKYPGKLITGSFVSKGSKLAYDRRVDKVVKVKVGRKSIKVAMTFVRCIESGAWVHTPDPMTSEVLLTF